MLNEKKQNVNVEIADELLKNVVGGTQGEAAAAAVRICPHCNASVSVSTLVNENALTCPQCGKTITIIDTVVGSTGTRFG